MTTLVKPFIIAALLTSVSGSGAWAQDLAASDIVPLHVQVTISRYQGDDLVSSLPYLLSATANGRGARCSLRMGVEVPIATTELTVNQAGEETPLHTFTYRHMGTNIDCEVMSVDDGRYRVFVNIDESSIYPGVAQSPYVVLAMTRLGELEAELAEQETRYLPQHPEIIKLNAEIARARLQIPAELRRDDNQASLDTFGDKRSFARTGRATRWSCETGSRSSTRRPSTASPARVSGST